MGWSGPYVYISEPWPGMDRGMWTMDRSRLWSGVHCELDRGLDWIRVDSAQEWTVKSGQEWTAVDCEMEWTKNGPWTEVYDGLERTMDWNIQYVLNIPITWFENNQI